MSKLRGVVGWIDVSVQLIRPIPGRHKVAFNLVLNIRNLMDLRQLSWITVILVPS